MHLATTLVDRLHECHMHSKGAFDSNGLAIALLECIWRSFGLRD